VSPINVTEVFAAAIRERRKAFKLSQEALAAKAGVHPTYVGLIERGKRSPTLRVAQALATALGTDLLTLLGPRERKTNPDAIAGRKG